MAANNILQVVSGEGELDKDSVQEWVRENGIDDCGVNFTVVAIMGPQSSGKSTLLNNLVRAGWGRALKGRGGGSQAVSSATSTATPACVPHSHPAPRPPRPAPPVWHSV